MGWRKLLWDKWLWRDWAPSSRRWGTQKTLRNKWFWTILALNKGVILQFVSQVFRPRWPGVQVSKQPKCPKVPQEGRNRWFSGLWSDNPKLVSCTVRNPVWGYFSDIVLQLQPIPPDSSTPPTNPSPGESFFGRFRVIFESWLENDSKTTQRAQILKKIKIWAGNWNFQARLKRSWNFKRDWKFQASHPPNPYFCGELSRSRLKISSEIEVFKSSSEIVFFQDSGPLGTRKRPKNDSKSTPRERGRWWESMSWGVMGCSWKTISLGYFSWCKTEFAWCERLFWASQLKDTKSLSALCQSTFGHSGCFGPCARPLGSQAKGLP